MSKRVKSAAETQQKEHAEDKKYPTKKLLKSRYLAEYQPDFARAILKKPAYSITEAKTVLENVLKGGR